MRRTGEGQIGEPQLSDMAQPLKERVVQHRAFTCGHWDRAVHWITDLGGA
jgi:hypothetical protein